MRSFTASLALVYVFICSLTVHAQTPSLSAMCAGDCDANGTVEVNEIIACVNIALENPQLSPCTPCDVNGDTHVEINEIIQATNRALNGCNPVPTATPMHTPTPTATPMTHTVVVGPDGNFVFDPPDLTIHVGETVEWTWASRGHNVVSGSDCTADNRFCSPQDSTCAQAVLSNQGTTYRHTFTSAGTYPYFCSAHCDIGMVGMLTVQ